MKQINFTNTDYDNLLIALGPDEAASRLVNMELDGEIYPVRLVVASKFAPKNPIIKFQYEDEVGIWFSIIDQTNGNINQVFIEHVGENNHSQNDGFCGEFSLEIAANDSLENQIIFQTESLNLPNQFITLQKINLTGEKFGSVGYFVNKYGNKNLEEICISEKFFKAGNKLLTAQVFHVNEDKYPGNDGSVQDKSKTIIENGKI
jgi:hypothetical protein